MEIPPSEESTAFEPESLLEYQYNPLAESESEIRLIVLHPGVYSDPLKISIVHANLDSKPEYFAISYVWGATTRQNTVQCDGTKLYITQNLEDGLRRIRDRMEEDRFQYLWADAICINQNDLDERSAQVRLMGRLYTEAVCVYAWLGEMPAVEGGDLQIIEALELLHRLGSYTSNSWNLDLLAGPQYLFEQYIQQHRLPSPVEYRSQYETLGKIIIKREFFTRVWTVQEVKLSRDCKILVSKVEFSRPLLLNASINALHLYWGYGDTEISTDLIRVTNLLSPYGNSLKSESFLSFVNNLRGCTTSDPRDMVYGLLGVSRDAFVSNIIPDYSLTPEEVFEQVTRKAIIGEESLYVLSYAGLSHDQDPFSPSWVTNFVNPLRFSLLQGYNDRNQKTATFCGTGPKLLPEVDWSRPKVLRIQGTVIDTLLGISFDFASQDETNISASRTLHVLFQELSGGNREAKYAGGGLLGEALALALRGECPTPAELPMALKQYIDQFWRYMDLIQQSGSNTTQEAISSVSRDDGLGVWNVIGNWRTYKDCLLTTKRSYLGVSHRAWVQGDKIVLLRGGPLPYILRPHGDEYLFVGPCYVHGIMEGEAMEWPDLEWKMFDII